jgi:hypothetical protein
MHKILLAGAALGVLTALTSFGAVAAPSATGVRMAPSQPAVTHVDYFYHRRHWQHRRWERNHWRYWD